MDISVDNQSHELFGNGRPDPFVNTDMAQRRSMIRPGSAGLSRREKHTASTTGYYHPSYAESWKPVGRPLLLACSGGWVIQRRIEMYGATDVMGCYPFLSCSNWDALEQDVERLAADNVSLVFVTDPFAEFDTGCLRRCCPHRFAHFKNHYITDLRRRPSSYRCTNHTRNVKKGMRHVTVEILDDRNEDDWLQAWVNLYANLVCRHGIQGITNLPKQTLKAQCCVPGAVGFAAKIDREIVGMLWWYGQQKVAYYHLGAFSDRGYETAASFALFHTATEYFSSCGFRWLSLGAGAGPTEQSDGLTRFKKGWATGTRPVFLCGRVFQEYEYQRLMQSRHISNDYEYFPGYRYPIAA